VRPRGPLIVVVLGFVIYAIWNFSQIFLLLLSTGYVLSGILVRLAGACGGGSCDAGRPMSTRPSRQPGHTENG